ncbi:GGDEF domain-containing protein [Agaribacterium haliotis]|uniref:GGDEF domain-containing protein n=1 Tax=Agaribacterium haliotis TaxID=2013869 RepID=UPI000BB570D6|nr:GGDEF domain-containing protein [Agaribacterium haliotis]
MSSANSYKDKYLRALDEQEKTEKRFAYQLEQLKKTMLQLATAASGMDTQLDASVLRLREIMRGGSGAQAIEQLEQVQRAVQQFEQQRSHENSKAVQAMQLLLDQYQRLQLPNDLKKSLTGFHKALNKRLSNFRQYAPALEELAKLQLLALEAASDDAPGLWQRLKGGRSLRVEQQAQPETQKTPISEQGDSDEQALHIPEQAPAQAPPISDTALANSAATLVQDEDSYAAVAERINRTLAKLVDNIEPNENIRHRIDIVRHRLARGMDWYVLAITLEDIRDILTLRYLQAEDEFGLYLNQLKEELGDIGEALAAAVEKEKNQNGEAAQFADKVQQGVERMKASVEATDKVDVLKCEVSSSLQFIHDALQQWQAQPKDALQEQLQTLVKQVQHFKKESEATKQALAEQRHLATHDPLTSLPNREAYSERSYQEWQRASRDGLPLTLAVCDIDHFKRINDNYGHQAGDKVLQLISSVIAKRLRNTDFIARYGGEEFVMLLPNTELDAALKVLDKIRALVEKSSLKFKGEPLQITISFGLAQLNSDEQIEHCFERADAALYQAKELGRNRCELAS